MNDHMTIWSFLLDVIKRRRRAVAWGAAVALWSLLVLLILLGREPEGPIVWIDLPERTPEFQRLLQEFAEQHRVVLNPRASPAVIAAASTRKRELNGRCRSIAEQRRIRTDAEPCLGLANNAKKVAKLRFRYNLLGPQIRDKPVNFTLALAPLDHSDDTAQWLDRTFENLPGFISDGTTLASGLIAAHIPAVAGLTVEALDAEKKRIVEGSKTAKWDWKLTFTVAQKTWIKPSLLVYGSREHEIEEHSVGQIPVDVQRTYMQALKDAVAEYEGVLKFIGLAGGLIGGFIGFVKVYAKKKTGRVAYTSTPLRDDRVDHK